MLQLLSLFVIKKEVEKKIKIICKSIFQRSSQINKIYKKDMSEKDCFFEQNFENIFLNKIRKIFSRFKKKRKLKHQRTTMMMK